MDESAEHIPPPDRAAWVTPRVGDRRLLAQPPVWARLVVVRDVCGQDLAQVRLVDDEEVIEALVLRLVARGLSNQEIAAALQISEPTARTHVSNMLTKLHLASRTQAALYALRAGLARLDEETTC